MDIHPARVSACYIDRVDVPRIVVVIMYGEKLDLVPAEREILLSALDDYVQRCQAAIDYITDHVDLRNMWASRLIATKNVRERVVAC